MSLKLSYRQQAGSTLVLGIFIITIMMLLATSLIRVNKNINEDVSFEVWGIRALTAANSAGERALSQLFPINAPVTNCGAISTTWTPPAGLTGFADCSVNINCSTVVVGTVTQFSIVSEATCESGDCSGGADSTTTCLRVNREVEMQVRTAP